MNLYRSLAAFTAKGPAICSIGMFDGVHAGHQRLIRSVVDEAQAREFHSVVITFDPHPSTVLGRAPLRELTDLPTKASLISALGAQNLIVLPFTRETMETTAEEFIKGLVGALHMTSLWIGQDFVLGKNRTGNAEFLRNRGAEIGFVVQVVPPLLVRNERVSSSRLRLAVAEGDRQLQAELMGQK